MFASYGLDTAISVQFFTINNEYLLWKIAEQMLLIFC